jgi:hypothetical protein
MFRDRPNHPLEGMQEREVLEAVAEETPTGEGCASKAVSPRDERTPACDLPPRKPPAPNPPLPRARKAVRRTARSRKVDSE